MELFSTQVEIYKTNRKEKADVTSLRYEKVRQISVLALVLFRPRKILSGKAKVANNPLNRAQLTYQSLCK